MNTDPIADMLTKIRNAITANHQRVKIPSSKIKKEIARILFEEGYIANYSIENEGVREKIIINLKYIDGVSAITALRRISKPGLRVYTSRKNIPVVNNGYGIAIISTPTGIVTDAVCRKKKVGGEVLCYVW